MILPCLESVFLKVVKIMGGRNNYFRFKQFTIIQEKSAMKVGVDSVLLGAWAPLTNPSRILDIGTGTGLLALMMAQRSPQSLIDAVEIDRDAFEEACYNVQQSKWADRITVIHKSFQQFAEECTEKYDFIICNPPYFKNTNGIKNDSRVKARDNESLSLADLFRGVKKILSVDGYFCLIYPIEDYPEMEKNAANCELFVNKKLLIRSKCVAKHIRVAMCFANTFKDFFVDEMVLHGDVRGKYSDKYMNLVSEFH